MPGRGESGRMMSAMIPLQDVGSGGRPAFARAQRQTPSEGRLVVVPNFGQVILGIGGRPGAGSALIAAANERITGQDLIDGDPAVVALGPPAAQLDGVDQRQTRMVVVGVQLAQERSQHHCGAGPDLVFSQCGDQAAPVTDRLDRVDDVLSGPGRTRRREPTESWDEPSWAL
jgi:hypothetical protein